MYFEGGVCVFVSVFECVFVCSTHACTHAHCHTEREEEGGGGVADRLTDTQTDRWGKTRVGPLATSSGF